MASHGDARDLRGCGRLCPAARPARGARRDRPVFECVAGFRCEGELRHYDEAAPRGPVLAEWPLRALLAREGFTAHPKAFEDKEGFLNVFNDPGTFDVAKILEHWADPLDIVSPGVAIKQYPCCGSTHPAIDAMIQIVRAHRIEREQVCQIDAWIPCATPCAHEPAGSAERTGGEV